VPTERAAVSTAGETSPAPPSARPRARPPARIRRGPPLHGLKIGREARDRFGITVCVGVAAMIFWQVAVNIGMVTGVLPVVGVTLPLISYGGSSPSAS
jgi:hypothetical protein